MSVTKKQRAYASRLGRDQARFEQDNQLHMPRPSYRSLYKDVTGVDWEWAKHNADSFELGVVWDEAYEAQCQLFRECNPHHFDSGRALSPTDLARCKRCHVSIMSGYLLPLETEE